MWSKTTDRPQPRPVVALGSLGLLLALLTGCTLEAPTEDPDRGADTLEVDPEDRDPSAAGGPAGDEGTIERGEGDTEASEPSLRRGTRAGACPVDERVATPMPC